MGTQTNAINRETGRGFLIVENRVPYASTAIPKSTEQFLEANRQRDIQRHAKKRLSQLAKAHNQRFARAA
jgi:hypothetical protein